jgi:hypothetical protein
LRPSAPRSDVVAYYRKKLERAESGELQGGMDIIAVRDGPDEIGVCGEFADDLEYALTAAQAGFGAIVGHQLHREKNQLPRRLRKESEDETVSPPVVRRRR